MNRGDRARKISVMQCEMIERDNLSRKKKPIVIASKKRSRWQSGICKICGEYLTASRRSTRIDTASRMPTRWRRAMRSILGREW